MKHEILRIKSWIILSEIVIVLSVSCNKASLPRVTTGTINSVSQREANCVGQVVSDGNAQIMSRGVCWNTIANPTISNNRTSDSVGVGMFISHITGLEASTTYHVRAYATNSEGTAYGDDVTFTTDEIAVPTLITSNLKSVTESSAKGGGDISNDGGTTILARGVCWNTSGSPTINDNHSTDDTGSGLFYSSITDIVIGTTYYVRAYATNSVGIAYGQEVAYTHTEPITDGDGNTYRMVTIGTQVWMAENLCTTKFSDGTLIPNVTEGLDWANTKTPAYCWYKNDASSYKVPYGALYNWYAVNTGKLCPAGWHVPSADEYGILVSYLGSANIAGGKMKETGTSHWISPNTGASNGSGFTGLPGGGRYNVYSDAGVFSDLGICGYHWTSTVGESVSGGISYDLSYTLNSVVKEEFSKCDGGSVRCIKNN